MLTLFNKINFTYFQEKSLFLELFCQNTVFQNKINIKMYTQNLSNKKMKNTIKTGPTGQRETKRLEQYAKKLQPRLAGANRHAGGDHLDHPRVSGMGLPTQHEGRTASARCCNAGGRAEPAAPDTTNHLLCICRQNTFITPPLFGFSISVQTTPHYLHYFK